MKVITYQSGTGAQVDLTRTQIKMLESAGVWPRDRSGQEFATVSHGLHAGVPSYTDEQMLAMVERRNV